jgi:glycosyltransferase involved in cell wall biosynthesis
MHITDTLDAGGLERVAINLVNHLPREQFVPFLCTTRRDGPLTDFVAMDVGRLRLERQHRFDWRALRSLVTFIQERDIRLLHAHSTSLLVATLASFFPPYPVVIWHIHAGRYAREDRPARLYRLLAKRVSGVIAANQPLAEWARRRLRLPNRQIWYMPNFVSPSPTHVQPCSLPGVAGSRIVCVANLRHEKDHVTLIQAMALVVQHVPSAHLLLVGASSDHAYVARIRREISLCHLEHHISLLGQRQDVSAILTSCDIGVLSSIFEAFPMGLIEYGSVGLPVIATRVGQCTEILDDGRAGLLVPPHSPNRLAEALLALLQSSERRAALAQRFHQRVQTVYSPGPILKQLCQIYASVLHLPADRVLSR